MRFIRPAQPDSDGFMLFPSAEGVRGRGVGSCDRPASHLEGSSNTPIHCVGNSGKNFHCRQICACVRTLQRVLFHRHFGKSRGAAMRCLFFIANC